MRSFTRSSNRLSGKTAHPIKINTIIGRENLCIVRSLASSRQRIMIRSNFVQNSRSNNIKIFVMQQKRKISIFWAAKFLSNIKQPFSGCGCEFLFKTVIKEV